MRQCGLRGLLRVMLPAAVAGAALAAVAVYAYYNDPWRSLAHILAPWAVLACVVAFRRPPLPAVVASVSSLAAAVVTFYVGLKLAHDIRWTGSGSVMTINWGDVQLWLLLAGLAGAVFGLLGATAARPDWRGAAATAALLGLLLGEAYRRSSEWGVDAAVAIDAAAAVLVFAVATGVNRRPMLTLALTAVAAVIGFGVVSTPDLLEQWLIEGF
ncbi:DUF6518 family protein [Geodermatophilus nigrescens]